MLAYLLSLALTLVPTQEPGDPPAAAIQSLDQQLEAFDRLRRLRAPSSEKIACLHAIGARGDRGGVDALMRLLGRLEGELAQAAVHGIALNGTPYANLKLRMLARDRTHPEVRRQACLDLARGTHDDLLFLRDKRLPKEKDLLIRGELLRNLIDREVEGLDQVVLKAARSRDNLYASVGVYGIGKLRLTKGLRLVEGCLNDPDLQLRLASMRALADFGGAESYRTLLRAYARPKNLALRPDIEKLLHQATRPTEIEVLIEEGLDDSNEEVVGACAAAVASAAAEHPELCTSALLSLLEHRTPAIRDFAIEGLVRARPEGVVPVLAEHLAHDHPGTRATAAWALARIGDLPPTLAPELIRLTEDESSAIRLHAVDALRSYPTSEEAFRATLACLEDQSWSVRSAAIASLLPFRRLESLGPLLTRATVEQGRVRDEAVEALCLLSGQDFGPTVAIWNRWHADLSANYALPSAEEAEARLADLRTRRARGHQSVVAQTYHGLQVPQGGVVFVMDISGSMTQPYSAGISFYDHFSTALATTIGMLDEKVQFNIVLFSSGVRVWHENLVPASPGTAQAARRFLADVRPNGPTNLHAALMTALSLDEVQTIFLLTDGDPTFGRIVVPEAILTELERVNRDRNVVIHTIAAGDVRADFLADLASGNGGEAVDLTGGPDLRAAD